MPPPRLSRRVRETDEPVIAVMRALVASSPDCASLAQGAVHWAPPDVALHAAQAAAPDPATSAYSADLGTDALRSALRRKLTADHGLPVVGDDGRAAPSAPFAYDVAVTAGANQAVASLALALTDPAAAGGAPAILFAPYYFNARMALQLAGAAIDVGPCDPRSWEPDAAWLAARLAARPAALVYVVSPGNPTGVALPRARLQALADATAAAGAWLVLDSTYEAFAAGEEEGGGGGGGAPPPSPPAPLPSGPHVIHVGSFSKAFGAAGWRVGWIAFPEDGTGALAAELLKVNDTIPIHAALASQALAAACLEGGGPAGSRGRAWARARVAALAPSRAAARAALQPLVDAGGAVAGGDAIYWWATLPAGCGGDDQAVCRWLVGKHGVAVVPGSACGCPGHVRVAFGKPAPGPAFEAAAARLRAGCEELAAAGGMDGVRAWLSEQGRGL